ncbi:hypothetical protein AWC38_SpisGene24163 [Stylophora pistillata]|uniref:Beta/gamma crystallin 'Greek key' domain-containing protein n=1 Tax=Stylophora pistillata TaxID=50429 RepID=A0A2B4R556_STYPI|nr:hypothetical protein AWC38_SpisGene24163 [Stylophora pistillata]
MPENLNFWCLLELWKMGDSTAVLLYKEENYEPKPPTKVTKDEADVKAIGLPLGARSLQVGSDAGDWYVYPKINFQGQPGRVDQGKDYPNPKEMGLHHHPVMSLKRVGS